MVLLYLNLFYASDYWCATKFGALKPCKLIWNRSSQKEKNRYKVFSEICLFATYCISDLNIKVLTSYQTIQRVAKVRKSCYLLLRKPFQIVKKTSCTSTLKTLRALTQVYGIICSKSNAISSQAGTLHRIKSALHVCYYGWRKIKYSILFYSILSMQVWYYGWTTKNTFKITVQTGIRKAAMSRYEDVRGKKYGKTPWKRIKW